MNLGAGWGVYDKQGDQIFTKEKRKTCNTLRGSKKNKGIPREANDDTRRKEHVDPCHSE